MGQRLDFCDLPIHQFTEAPNSKLSEHRDNQRPDDARTTITSGIVML